METRREELEHVRKWSRALLDNPNAIIIDTETTGLTSDDRICDFAAIATDGHEIVNTRINPEVPVGYRAAQIHKLTNEILAGENTWGEFFPDLCEILRVTETQDIVIYNANFDMGMIRSSTRGYPQCAEPWEWWESRYPTARCAMLAYAMYVGEWNDYYCNYRWQRLPGGDHTAMGDCKATLKVLKRMAESEE